MKLLRTSLLNVLVFIALTVNAQASEVYLLGGNPVLLYKIINWWYDCPPEDAYNYCGSRIACRNDGDTTIRYDAGEKTLNLAITGGFADLLSVFKACRKCHGPAYLKCTYLNQTYFGKAYADDIVNDGKGLNSFDIKHVDGMYRDRIQRIMKSISVELRGVVRGLMDGKISLHCSGECLKICPGHPKGCVEEDPITLTIMDLSSQEVLATYSAVWNEN